MAEVGGLVAPLAFVYSAALAGLVAALLVRAGARHGGRTPSLLEAGWCAFLPLLTVLLLSAVAVVQPHPLPPFDAAHAWWHRWESAIHRSATLHGALHGANWLVLMVGAGLIGRTVFAWSRMRSFETALQRTAQATSSPAFYSIPAARPSCFTLGLLWPRVYLTTGLQAQLSPRDLEAVLAHEAAHVRRRDTLLGAVLTLFYTLLPLPGSRLLLRDWSLAVERACDREAARRIGSRYDVALALVRVARLVALPAAALPNSACFTEWGEDVEGRVQALLQPADVPAPSSLATRVLAAFSAGSLAAATLWVPHVVDLFAHH